MRIAPRAMLVLALLLLCACPHRGFRVRAARATYASERWLLDLEEPQPQRRWGEPAGWGLMAAREDRVGWAYTETAPDAPGGERTTRLLLVIAVEDPVPLPAGRQPWTAAWDAAPGLAALAALQRPGIEPIRTEAPRREAVGADAIDVVPVLARVLHEDGASPAAPLTVAGHLACRRTPGVPILACVLGGRTDPGALVGPGAVLPSVDLFTTTAMQENETWVRGVLASIQAVKKEPAKPGSL